MCRFYIECVLVDEKTVLCQFKARSAANSETVILQGFFISRVEKRYNSRLPPVCVDVVG
jgi:hypothetical protein